MKIFLLNLKGKSKKSHFRISVRLNAIQLTTQREKSCLKTRFSKNKLPVSNLPINLRSCTAYHFPNKLDPTFTKCAQVPTFQSV